MELQWFKAHSFFAGSFNLASPPSDRSQVEHCYSIVCKSSRTHVSTNLDWKVTDIRLSGKSCKADCCIESRFLKRSWYCSNAWDTCRFVEAALINEHLTLSLSSKQKFSSGHLVLKDIEISAAKVPIQRSTRPCRWHQRKCAGVCLLEFQTDLLGFQPI